MGRYGEACAGSRPNVGLVKCSAADLPSAASVKSRASKGVKEEMKITFDEFGWPALEERAAEQGAGLDEMVWLALSY